MASPPLFKKQRTENDTREEPESESELEQEGSTPASVATSASASALASRILLSPPSPANLHIFPVKLHQLLEDAEKEGNENIISWMPNGKTFKIHNKEKFETLIMPRYFGSSKYRSFQKNLNLWQYITIAAASSTHPNRGEITHPLFVRGKPELCQEMTRIVGSVSNNNNSNNNTINTKNKKGNEKKNDSNDKNIKPPAPAAVVAAGTERGPHSGRTAPQADIARSSDLPQPAVSNSEFTPARREEDFAAMDDYQGARVVTNGAMSVAERPLISQLRRRASMSSADQQIQQQLQQHLQYLSQMAASSIQEEEEQRKVNSIRGRNSLGADDETSGRSLRRQEEDDDQQRRTSGELESLLRLSQLLSSSSRQASSSSPSPPSAPASLPQQGGSNSLPSSLIGLLSTLVEQRSAEQTQGGATAARGYAAVLQANILAGGLSDNNSGGSGRGTSSRGEPMFLSSSLSYSSPFLPSEPSNSPSDVSGNNSVRIDNISRFIRDAAESISDLLLDEYNSRMQQETTTNRNNEDIVSKVVAEKMIALFSSLPQEEKPSEYPPHIRHSNQHRTGSHFPCSNGNPAAILTGPRNMGNGEAEEERHLRLVSVLGSLLDRDRSFHTTRGELRPRSQEQPVESLLRRLREGGRGDVLPTSSVDSLLSSLLSSQNTIAQQQQQQQQGPSHRSFVGGNVNNAGPHRRESEVASLLASLLGRSEEDSPSSLSFNEEEKATLERLLLQQAQIYQSKLSSVTGLLGWLRNRQPPPR